MNLMSSDLSDKFQDLDALGRDCFLSLSFFIGNIYEWLLDFICGCTGYYDGVTANSSREVSHGDMR